jgi:hypothetical protein
MIKIVIDSPVGIKLPPIGHDYLAAGVGPQILGLGTT